MNPFRSVTNADERNIHDICYGCGSDSMKRTHAYLRRAVNLAETSGVPIVYETNGDAFYLATVARDHLRLIALAVIENAQGNGVGSAAVRRLKQIAVSIGKHRITLRTSMRERGKDFWLKQRARIVGVKGEDFEMELVF